MNAPELNDLPLATVRVLDLAAGELALAGRILGDLGADVIRVVFDELAPSTLEDEVLDLVRHANKRSVAAAELSADEREALVRSADIVLLDRPALDRGWSPAGLRAVKPQLVVGVITDFGLDGPARDWVLSDQVLQAMSGVLANSGRPGGPPVLAPGSITTRTALSQATWPILVAYYHRLRTGRGDVVDVSVYESALHAMDPAFGIAGSAAGGVPVADGPRGRPDVGFRYPILACGDGHVRVCMLAPHQWLAMHAWMGAPEEFADPKYLDRYERFAASRRLDQLLEGFFAGKTRDELTEEGQRRGVPIQGLMSLTEVLDSPHLDHRQAFTDVAVPAGHKVRLAAGAVNLGGERAGLRRLPPAAGVHTEEVLGDLDGSSRRQDLSPPGESPARPFEGLRVLDLGVIVLGAEVGRMFADFGADVIKVENRNYPDATRITASETMAAPFAWGHRGKRALGLDLRSPEGIEIFIDLVRRADVVLSNFKPGTMESLGIGHQRLLAANPSLVYLESSAFGATGPWRNRMGYGPLVRSAVGLTRLWTSEEEPHEYADRATVYPDHAAARMCALAVLANLIARDEGRVIQPIEVSQAEIILTHLADVLALESAQPGRGAQWAATGGADTPSGLFACAGDDEWCVVTVGDDAQFAAWCQAVQKHELIDDPSYATRAGRWERRFELVAIMRDWAKVRPAVEVMTTLQGFGVPAGMMLRHGELPSFAHLVEREFYGWLHQPQIGAEPVRTEIGIAKFQSVPRIEARPAPEVGEHTCEIAMDVLGMSSDLVDDLIGRGTLQALGRWA